jgi:chromatin remodeling complex protein RSC6
MASSSTAAAATSPTETAAPATVKFQVIFDKLHSMQNLLREIQTQLKTAHKDFSKVVKESNNNRKKSSKRNKTDQQANAAPRPPSGFAKPTHLSAALCAFLDVSDDTMLARTDVTRKINQYIKDHRLQDTEDKRNINPDDKLRSLLDPSDTSPLTYFNLQSRIKHHFVKVEAAS